MCVAALTAPCARVCVPVSRSLESIVDLFTSRPIAWITAVATGTGIALATLFVHTRGRAPADGTTTPWHSWRCLRCLSVCSPTDTRNSLRLCATCRAELGTWTRRCDAFLRAFLAAAWSGYSNFASKAVVEVAFSSVSHHTAHDWARVEVYILVVVMGTSLFMQVRGAAVCDGACVSVCVPVVCPLCARHALVI